jgi:hypothetical protein
MLGREHFADLFRRRFYHLTFIVWHFYAQSFLEMIRKLLTLDLQFISYDALEPFSVSLLLTGHALRLKNPILSERRFHIRGKREGSHSSAATVGDGGYIYAEARAPTIRAPRLSTKHHPTKLAWATTWALAQFWGWEARRITPVTFVRWGTSRPVAGQ